MNLQTANWKKPSLDQVCLDLFLAAPMSGFDDNAEYEAHRKSTMDFCDLLEDKISAEVYYAGKRIHSTHDFSGSNNALATDLGGLHEANVLILLYPRKVASSALVEVGIAIGKRYPVLMIVPDRSMLPYMLQEAENWNDPDDLVAPIGIVETSDPRNDFSRVEEFLDDARIFLTSGA